MYIALVLIGSSCWLLDITLQVFQTRAGEGLGFITIWSYTLCWISEMICVFVCTHAGVVRAYDEAWQLDKANCHKYFR